MADFDDIYYIRQIKNGKVDAFVYIVRRYQRMVFTIVNKIVSRSVEAEDITQEVFIKVFQSLDKFREESEFATWLYRVAYNTTISELRKRKHEFIAIDDRFDNLPDESIFETIDELNHEDRLAYLDIVLKRLSPDDALLISMFYMNDQSIQQISEITNNSVANVKVKLHRIRKFMNFEINKLIRQ
ncbi:sigma-70 family RNA polymerase sigma factor [Dysgonomonas sp. Marseille-P4677]|uniref:RNA polymerase sigma factor n=1 Tax=Dysgonomonas sp. Marseille-P4677 TaxID=2364790 RepID=UPI001911943D|nr:sigma-70 family RNA polymerase sigma factor [Dysgonomonas sp. Marseille-P4677]MBK5721893.1 sigma-70 family RNA polymerase sigma factor [Dysgonomonas sp. Marseille-P4677]